MWQHGNIWQFWKRTREQDPLGDPPFSRFFYRKLTDTRLVTVPVKDKEGCSKCTSCKLFYLLLADIGNPPQHLPIIDGGEGTPKLVIIGQDFTPATEDLKGKTTQTGMSHCHDNSRKFVMRAWYTVNYVITTQTLS